MIESRRARQRVAQLASEGKLRAAFDRIELLEAQLVSSDVVRASSGALGLTNAELAEVHRRLVALVPGLAAQVQAASAGVIKHSSRGLVANIVQARAGVAKHCYPLPERFEQLSLKDLNRIQRQKDDLPICPSTAMVLERPLPAGAAIAWAHDLEDFRAGLYKPQPELVGES